MAKVKFTIEGMEELIRSMERLGKVPQKHVTSAARKGMNIPLKEARSKAPMNTGDLKRGIVLKGEKSRHKAKKVYRIVFDSAMNNVFQKPIKNPGSRGGSGKDTGYYPISQEYGYFAGEGNYIPGFRFISSSFTANIRTLEGTIVRTLKSKLDAEIKKAGLS